MEKDLETENVVNRNALKYMKYKKSITYQCSVCSHLSRGDGATTCSGCKKTVCSGCRPKHQDTCRIQDADSVVLRGQVDTAGYMETYAPWLRSQMHRQDPVGEFARFMVEDWETCSGSPPLWHPAIWGHSSYDRHLLEYHEVPRQLFNAGTAAWLEFYGGADAVRATNTLTHTIGPPVPNQGPVRPRVGQEQGTPRLDAARLPTILPSGDPWPKWLETSGNVIYRFRRGDHYRLQFINGFPGQIYGPYRTCGSFIPSPKSPEGVILRLDPLAPPDVIQTVKSVLRGAPITVIRGRQLRLKRRRTA